MNLTSEKKQIRQRVLAARNQLSPDQRAQLDAAITLRLLLLPEYQRATTVLGYMNFGGEYASDLWIKNVLKDGKRLLLPKVNRDTDLLDLYHIDDPDKQLNAGLWGIREPVIEHCKRPISINEVEFALLPGVAFSRNGARLGYGGGFYDKLLAFVPQRPALVTAAYALQIVQDIPQEATDVKVRWIVTETETIVCTE